MHMHGAMSLRPKTEGIKLEKEACKEMAQCSSVLRVHGRLWLRAKERYCVLHFAETRPKNGAHKPLFTHSVLIQWPQQTKQIYGLAMASLYYFGHAMMDEHLSILAPKMCSRRSGCTRLYFAHCLVVEKDTIHNLLNTNVGGGEPRMISCLSSIEMVKKSTRQSPWFFFSLYLNKRVYGCEQKQKQKQYQKKTDGMAPCR